MVEVTISILEYMHGEVNGPKVGVQILQLITYAIASIMSRPYLNQAIVFHNIILFLQINEIMNRVSFLQRSCLNVFVSCRMQ